MESSWKDALIINSDGFALDTVFLAVSENRFSIQTYWMNVEVDSSKEKD